MLITVIYKDASTRIIRPAEVFFQRNDKNQLDIKAIKEKAIRLISDTGKYYRMEVFYGDQHLALVEIEKNAPTPYEVLTANQKIAQRVKNKKRIAELKKDLKDKFFTVRSRDGRSFPVTPKLAA